MKKSLVVLLIIGLIVSLFSTLIISRTCRFLKEENLKLKSDLSDCLYLSARAKHKNNQCLFSENKILPNLLLLNNKGDSVRLKNIIHKSKLVYRFYSNTCVQCVEDELDIVKQLGDKIGAHNIVIIGDFEKINMLNAILIRKQITSPSFIYRSRFDLPIEKDGNNIASFFLLSQNLYTKFVYKAGGNQNIDDYYYKRIINFFKTGN